MVSFAINPRNVSQSVRLPSPNGYDHFLQATNKLGPAFDIRKDYTTEELRAIAAGNAEVLPQVRSGLQRNELKLTLISCGSSQPSSAIERSMAPIPFN